MRIFVWFWMLLSLLGFIFRLDTLISATFPKVDEQSKVSYFRWTLVNLAVAIWAAWILFRK